MSGQIAYACLRQKGHRGPHSEKGKGLPEDQECRKPVLPRKVYHRVTKIDPREFEENPLNDAAKPQPTGPESLATRERELLDLYIKLGVNKLIAYEMGISEQTIKNYASSILKKLGTNSTGQAAVIYDRWLRGPEKSYPGIDRRSGLERRKN